LKTATFNISKRISVVAVWHNLRNALPTCERFLRKHPAYPAGPATCHLIQSFPWLSFCSKTNDQSVTKRHVSLPAPPADPLEFNNKIPPQCSPHNIIHYTPQCCPPITNIYSQLQYNNCSTFFLSCITKQPNSFFTSQGSARYPEGFQL